MTQDESGEFVLGKGKISGVLSTVLGLMSLGAVICFHYPEYFTMPALRAIYPIAFLRGVLATCIFLPFSLGIVSLVLNKSKTYALLGILLALLATSFGGSHVALPDQVVSDRYLGLDWFILDLLILCLMFIPLERLFARVKKQKIFRPEWNTDLIYFFANHLMVQSVSLIILAPALLISGHFSSTDLQSKMQSQPVWLQFIEILIVADFSFYWIHRTFHKNPFLWRIHAVHHSIENMDWLAGSRLHILETLIFRSLTLVPLFLLGFSQASMSVYLVFVAFHATLIHANMAFDPPYIRRLIATPAFHHWHHAIDQEAIDKNFSVHIPLYDRMFGTYHMPEGRWPTGYGISGEKMPQGIFKQFLFPFFRAKTAKTNP